MLNFIVKYLKHRQTVIILLLKKPRNKYSIATFHKLRVEIKKIKALVELINYCSKDFHRKKTFEPFRLVFRKAGKVRELQLEEKMLKKYFLGNSLTNFRNNLKKVRLRALNDFFLMKKDKNLFIRLNKSFVEVESNLEKVNHKKVDHFMEKKRKVIKKLLGQSALEIQHLHALRKQFKLLYYLKKSIADKTDKVKISKQEILQTLLGEWHDCRVIIRHLNETMELSGINSSEFKQLEKIERKISSKSEILFTKISKAIPKSEFYEKSKS